MRKFTGLILIIILLTANLPNYYAQAAGAKSGSVAVPITTGLAGSDNSAKSFYLDLPSGVTSSTIVQNTLKYTGNNQTIGNTTIENGKIKITLRGSENKKVLEKVKGYQASFGEMYATKIYNSIWLYSDGRRWQINEYDERNDRMKTKDVHAADGYPSQNPPTTLVTAGPLQDQLYLKWYNGSKTEVIDSKDIISSTIKPIISTHSPYTEGEPTFKNGRVIINYYIPNSTPWEKEPDDGLSGKAEGRKYFARVTYYYEANANVTTYSYGGLVTFDYNLPDEPTLTGAAILEKPSPNPAKFEDKDVPVQINLKGELLAYKDSSNIEEWVFYAKEKGNDSTLKTLKDYSKTLTSAKRLILLF